MLARLEPDRRPPKHRLGPRRQPLRKADRLAPAIRGPALVFAEQRRETRIEAAAQQKQAVRVGSAVRRRVGSQLGNETKHAVDELQIPFTE